MENNELVFRRVENGEKSRTYFFSNDRQFTVKNVIGVAVSKSGTHRLETEDGKKFIVNSGWLAIEIEAEFWSF